MLNLVLFLLSKCLIFVSVVFKYGFTWWVDKKIATKIKWAATARVAQEAGFRGVLVIRYSIVPPRESSPPTSGK